MLCLSHSSLSLNVLVRTGHASGGPMTSRDSACVTTTAPLRPVDGLVVRLQQAEPAAIGEAYDMHGPSVLAFARRLVGDADAAQDLVQDTFMTLPKVVGRFEGRSSLRSFLISIAVNHARHHVRAASRRRAAMERYAREPRGGSVSPEDDALRADLADALTCALDKLSLDQRVAFVLCEVEERSAKEAGEIAGAPEATMRTRVFHAKKKLREALARSAREGGLR